MRVTLRTRLDAVLLGALLIGVQLAGRRTPGGIYGLGVVSGAALAVQATGLVLVYRTNRIINFAQVQLGATAATMFALLVQYGALVRAVQAICPPCLERVTPGVLRANYVLALLLALAFAAGLGALTNLLVVKRFERAPRLVLTVATIFLVQLLGGLQGALPRILTSAEQREQLVVLAAARPPVDITLTWSPARFHLPDVLTVLAAALAIGGLVVYLRSRRTGIAIRAAASDATRASTLGIAVDRVSTRVWLVAGLLSGIAATTSAMTTAPAQTAGVDVASTVRILAVAVIARMTSLPGVAAAALALGAIDQSFLWSFSSTVALDAILLVVIGAVLFVQQPERRRADDRFSAWRAAHEGRGIPRELRTHPTVRRWTRALVGSSAAALLAVPWATSAEQTDAGTLTLVYAIVGLSLLILTGWAGQISLGQFAFAAAGAWASGVAGLPFPLSIALGAAAGAAVAIVVGLPALKLRGLHLAVTTLAFALATTAALANVAIDIDRPVIAGMDLDEPRTFYYVVLACTALAAAAVAGMRRTDAARSLIAARDNEPAAQAFGIDLVRARLGAFAASGALAAAAGVLYAYHQRGVRPAAFAPELSITMFLMAAIGGLSSVSGPLLGALLLGALLVGGANPVVVFLSTGLGGLVILLLVPGGLSQLASGLRDGLLRRLARRERIAVPSLITDVHTGKVPIAPGAGSAPVYHVDGQWALEHRT